MQYVTRTRLIAVLIIGLCVTIGWEAYTVMALSAGNRNTIIPPGGATIPCTWDVFVDGSNTDVKNCQTGEISYINADPTIAIQNANDNCPSAACIIFIEHGSYPLTVQINSGLSNYVAAGIQLSTGTSLICENRNAVTFTGPAIPGAQNNAYWVAITNTHRSTSDSHVTVQNCGFSLPAPTQTATGLKSFDAAIQFDGCNYCLVKGNLISAGSIALRANTANENTATALTAGKNYGNLVTENVILQQPETTWFLDESNSTFSYNIINQCWDDCFIIGGAGIRNIVNGNVISGNAVVSNKGAATADIYLQNDKSVCASASAGCLSENIVENNIVENMTGHFSGPQGGIADLRARENLFVGNEVSRNGGTVAQGAGFGIRTENALSTVISSNQISYQNGDGIHVYATETGTYFDFLIIGNQIFDNGIAAQNNAAIRLAPNGAGDKLQDVVISSNNIWDDTGSSLQNYAFRFDLTDTLTNTLIIGNNVIRSPNFLNLAGTTNLGVIQIRSNPGYNPVGKVGSPFGSASTIGPFGNAPSVNPTASTTYTLIATDQIVTSAAGTGVSITVKDNSGNSVISGAATITAVFMPVGWTINFGAFSGAPTVIDDGV